MRRTPLVLLPLLVLLASCAAAPVAGPPVERYGGNAVSALAADPIVPGQGMRVTPLVDHGRYTVRLVQVRDRVQPHFHETHEELVFIMRGKGLLTVDGETRLVKAGDVFVVPRGAIHAYQHEGEGVTAALSIMTPRDEGEDRHALTE